MWDVNLITFMVGTITGLVIRDVMEWLIERSRELATKRVTQKIKNS